MVSLHVGVSKIVLLVIATSAVTELDRLAPEKSEAEIKSFWLPEDRTCYLIHRNVCFDHSTTLEEGGGVVVKFNLKIKSIKYSRSFDSKTPFPNIDLFNKTNCGVSLHGLR